MDLPVTLAAAAVALLSAIFCGWRGARPLNILKGPRLMPWRPLMMLSAVVFLMLMAHVAGLFGIETGNRTRY